MLIIWTSLLFLLLVGFSMYARMRDDSRLADFVYNTWAKVLWLEQRTKFPYAIAAWLVIRIFHNIGLVLSIELAAFAILANYFIRVQRREQRRLVEATKVRWLDPDVAKRTLRDDLPRWVTFPSVERCAWLSSIIASMWTEIASSTQNTLRESLDEIFRVNCPGFLSSLSLGRCRLGSVPPSIEGIEVHAGAGETVIDIRITWVGEPDIRVVAAMNPLVVEAVVTNLQFRANMRVVLGPHVAMWPCFQAVRLSFVSRPTIDFQLSAAKVNLDLIPGFGNWLDGFLRTTLADLMVYPRRLTIPVVSGYSAEGVAALGDALGTLEITVDRCTDLPRGMFSVPKVSVTARFLDDDEKSWKTNKVVGTSPQFDGKPFLITVYDRHAQIRLDVSDESSFGVRSPGSSLIGSRVLYVNTLLDKPFTVTEELARPTHKKSKFVGTITYRTVFHPFSSGSRQGSPGGAMPTPPTSIPRRALSKPNSPHDGPHLPPRTPSARATSSERGGVLFITVVQANNLRNLEFLGKSDPYVRLQVGANVVKTECVKGDLNPVYNADFEIRFNDADREALMVDVIDWEMLGKNRKMASTSIQLIDIVNNNNWARNAYSLTPQGTITLELKLRFH